MGPSTLVTGWDRRHTLVVAEGPKRRRVFVEDARRDGTYLRVTWHPEGGQFVVSTWDDELCTAAVRIKAADAAGLIAVLADGMAAAAEGTAPVPLRRANGTA